MDNAEILKKAEQGLKRKAFSSIYRRLQAYGDAEKLLSDAIAELRDRCVFVHDGIALTPKYLFDFGDRDHAVIPLESVLWVFRLQDMRYSLKKRREVMHYHMRIYTITGDRFVLRSYQKKDLDTIEDLLTERYPNFFYGYSEEQEGMVHFILEENRKELKALKR